MVNYKLSWKAKQKIKDCAGRGVPSTLPTVAVIFPALSFSIALCHSHKFMSVGNYGFRRGNNPPILFTYSVYNSVIVIINSANMQNCSLRASPHYYFNLDDLNNLLSNLKHSHCPKCALNFSFFTPQFMHSYFRRLTAI